MIWVQAAGSDLLLDLAGRPEVPVYAGCVRPMVRDLFTAEYVHGPTGIDGTDLPEPAVSVREEHAVDFIVDTCMTAEPESVTLCPVGPLTNIATAIAKEPAIVTRIREIALMGGGFFEGGNTTPVAEFNIYVDPLTKTKSKRKSKMTCHSEFISESRFCIFTKEEV